MMVTSGSKGHTKDDRFGIKWFYNSKTKILQSYIMETYDISHSWFFYITHDDKRIKHNEVCQTYHKAKRKK